MGMARYFISLRDQLKMERDFQQESKDDIRHEL